MKTYCVDGLRHWMAPVQQLLFLAALLTLSAPPSRADEPAKSPPARRVVIFGDSITAGSLLPKAEKPRLWVTQVEAASNGALALLNEGKGGRPTASVAEFEAMLKRHDHVDLLVLALGANDARDTSASCVPNAVKNLRIMLLRGREMYGATLPVLLVAPTNIRKGALGPSKPIADQREANLVAMNTAFQDLAKAENCAFVSTYGLIPPESLARDGVHPDAAGNDAMTKILLPAILKAPGLPHPSAP